jgi:type IV pilus assembly protein PilO
MAAAKKGGAGLENLSLIGKIAVAVVFTLMVGAAYFVVFYGEIDGNIAAQIQLKAQKENDLTSAEDADRAYNKDLTELERRKQIAVKQKKILPDTAEWAPFLDTVQRSATISGITLAKWEPKGEVREDFFVKVPMQVSVTGRYHQIAKFFSTIGQSDRIINMANIGLKIDTGARKKSTKPGANINEGEESIIVKVTAMATAFRAVGEADGGGKKRGRRGRTGRK